MCLVCVFLFVFVHTSVFVLCVFMCLHSFVHLFVHVLEKIPVSDPADHDFLCLITYREIQTSCTCLSS